MSQSLKHKFVSGKADGGDATLVKPSNWNADHDQGPILTNGSGVTLNANDVTVQDTGADEGVVTTTTIGSPRPVFVAAATIVNAATGLFRQPGTEATVAVQGNVTRGEFLRTSATAGKAERCLPTGLTQGLPAGAFAVALTTYSGGGAGTVEALLFAHTTQAVGVKGPDIASAASITPDPSGIYFHVTGTTLITTIVGGPGRIIILEFDGACNVQYNASTLILLGAINFAASPGDVLILQSEGANSWREVKRSDNAPEATVDFFDDFLVDPLSGWGADTPFSVLDEVNGVLSVGDNLRYVGAGVSTVDMTKSVTFEVRQAQKGAGAGARRFGLTPSTGLSSDPANGIYFRHTAAGNYIAVCRASNVETTFDTGVAAAQDVYHRLRFYATPTAVTFFVDGVFKTTITTNIPTSTAVRVVLSGVTGQAKFDYVRVRYSRG